MAYKVHYPDFSREELQALRKRAMDMAQTEGLSVGWERMYCELADATDHLDAAKARIGIKSVKEVKKDGKR